MAIYYNLPIYKSAYSLLEAFGRMLPNVPRDCRYSIGQDVRNKIMEIVVMIYRANRIHRKLPVLAKMHEALVEVQVYIRLMCDLRYISEGMYVVLMDHSADVSKQLSAWEKSEQRKQSDGPERAND